MIQSVCSLPRKIVGHPTRTVQQCANRSDHGGWLATEHGSHTTTEQYKFDPTRERNSVHGESLTVQSRRDCIDFCANEVFLSRDENGGERVGERFTTKAIRERTVARGGST